MRKVIAYFSIILFFLMAIGIVYGKIPSTLNTNLKNAKGIVQQADTFGSANLRAVKKRVLPRLKKKFADKGHSWGSPIFIRIFKQSSELEVWVKKSGKFHLFKTYPICSFSGDLGPKLRQGDEQAPEGFYFVREGQLHPNSRYHLSFNLGYPNAYDRHHKRTGDFLMVHGNCVSIGCYAMTNKGVEEIYLMAEAALTNGQPFFRVHIFPFRLTEQKLGEMKDHKWITFLDKLKRRV